MLCDYFFHVILLCSLVSCQGVLISGFSLPTGNHGVCVSVPSATCPHQLWCQSNAEGSLLTSMMYCTVMYSLQYPALFSGGLATKTGPNKKLVSLFIEHVFYYETERWMVQKFLHTKYKVVVAVV